MSDREHLIERLEEDRRDEQCSRRTKLSLQVCMVIGTVGSFLVLIGMGVILGEFYRDTSSLMNAAQGVSQELAELNAKMSNVTGAIDDLLHCVEHMGICATTTGQIDPE